MKTTTLAQAAELMGIASHSHRPLEGVAVDSRLVKPGDLFFALPGNRTNGHTFLSQAASQGAAAAVVSNTYHGDSFGMPLLHTPDTLIALQELAKNLLKQRNPKIVAITGSVGKTTTKEMVSSILKQKFRTAASPGNSNSQIGLPLAILNHTNGDEEVLVLEMGMTHTGGISKLVAIAPPDLAVITSVFHVHAENFDSLSDIARAKGEILHHPRTQLGIISRDIEDFEELWHTGACDKLSFSVTSEASDYFLRDCGNMLKIGGAVGDIAEVDPLKIPGSHNKHNFLAAVVVARVLGVEWELIKEASTNLELPEKRLQRIERDGILFINDSYNAPFVAVKSALAEMPEPKKGGRRIAVLGEMAELGKLTEEFHRQIGEHSLIHVDRMFCLGGNCKPICEVWQGSGKPADLFMNRADLVGALRKELAPGDVVLLKGSRAKELWKVLDEL